MTKPINAPANLHQLLQEAFSLQQQGRASEAKKIYKRVVELEPKHFQANHLWGVAELQSGDPTKALQLISRAIQLKANDPQPYVNRGLALVRLKRYKEAISDFNSAIKLKPDYATAISYKAVALFELREYDQSLIYFDEAVRLRPDYAEAFHNRGKALAALEKYDEALLSFARASSLNPRYPDAFNERGYVLRILGRHDEAITAFQRAININPEFADAYANLGDALQDKRELLLAIASYGAAKTLNPNIDFLKGTLLHCRMKVCDWQDFYKEVDSLRADINDRKPASPPFAALGLFNDPTLLKKCAEIYTRKNFLSTRTSAMSRRTSAGHRITLGYYSADFHDHATSRLMADLFENHDRSKFRVVAFSFGPDKDDAMRKRLVPCFDSFHKVSHCTEAQIADHSRRENIDIALDLKGFTKYSKFGIFALGAAPIQVNFLGFPGTLGAKHYDYIIADRVIIPDEDVKHYTEKAVLLPNSYQPNDRKRTISSRTLSRSECGLPDNGFVFCCFNKTYKITPPVFDIWMELLLTVEKSVLWLFEDNTFCRENLRNEARKRSVNPNRLLFAQKLPLEEHLTRHRCADLFLDTFPYNAHTTASDALWTGLPLLTQIGETFAGRVAASLLNAVGLPELVTKSTKEYKSMAIELAKDEARLASIKQKLSDGLPTAPLFDAKLYTQYLEAAYTTMYERCKADLPPAHIYVSP